LRLEVLRSELRRFNLISKLREFSAFNFGGAYAIGKEANRLTGLSLALSG